MGYQIIREIVVVTDDTGHAIARARGSDATGWMAMSVSENGLHRPVRGGALHATARAALASRILPDFIPDLDAALKRAHIE